MTVGELVKKLQGYPPETPVMVLDWPLEANEVIPEEDEHGVAKWIQLA